MPVIHFRLAFISLMLVLLLANSVSWAQGSNTAEPETGSNTEPAAEPEPPAESAGNVAEASGDEEGGEAGRQPADSTGELDFDENIFLDLLDEDFPEFADDEPGFIPDLEPDDLFAEPPGSLRGFQTMLGPSHLPGSDVEGLIRDHQRNPERNLNQNQARIVVDPDALIQGSTETKQFKITGGLVIFYSDVTISADNADIDEKQEVAVLRGNVAIVDPKYSLKTDSLLIYFEEKRFQAEGYVQLKKLADLDQSEPDMALPKQDRLREYFAGQKFELFCNEFYYDWDKTTMTAIGAVKLAHPSFNGTMERMDYNDETKEYDLSGRVVLEVTKYDWIFKNKLVGDEEDAEKLEALTDEPMKINCDRVVYSEDSGIAMFYKLGTNRVKFEQPSRSITADYIEINDKTKDFYAEATAEGLVSYDQRDGEWLFTAGVVSRDDVADDLSEALEGSLSAKSRLFIYNYDRKRLELVGAVEIKAGQRLIQAGELIQDDTAKFFLLRDNVTLMPDPDSEIKAAQVYIDTANDVMTLVGLVTGKLTSEDLAAFSESAEEAAEEQTRQAPGSSGGYTPQAGLFRQTGSAGSERDGDGANVAES
jgi:lipopolysaccharide export system protein LptA